jgi:LmbE family N-acetylglucosaminyl deacetylase
MTPGDRWMIVAAHPDDDTVGATWLLRRLPCPVVVHVTDGAPRDPRLWSPAAPGSRERYARVRAREARQALALAGILPGQIRRLGVIDQEAAHELPALAHALAALVAQVNPFAVVVQPYEGGHPDHDACAFATRAALALERRRGANTPHLIEMTSYHRRGGTLQTGAFLPGGPPAVELRLSPAEQALKRRMFACFATQAEVLAPFDVKLERFRRAPRYDFTCPPHHGPLYYETLAWGMRSDEWCALAARALAQLGLDPDSPDERSPFSDAIDATATEGSA